MSNSQHQIDTGSIIRRSLFFLVLIILTLGNLFIFFRGLNSPTAMDQAQIAREIYRGNGFTTKLIRPIAYEQTKEMQIGAEVPFTGLRDTYHSPLNPLLNAAVFKLVGADNTARWKMGESEMIFPLDRVVAAVSTLCFLMSIGMVYLLISRVFDGKIAGVTAVLMLFCETFWEFSLAGLPQMFMLLLFSCAIYFVYRAVEDTSEGRIPFIPALIAGIFFTLLALTHYVTIWISLGYIFFAAVAFRPRGVVGISILLTLLVPMVFVMLRNSGISGSPFGTAFLSLYNGIGGGNEDIIMRSRNVEAYPLLNRGFFSMILRTTLLQTTSLIPFLGGIIVAPVFLISLMHPFKRPSIATFRWAILLMFCVSAFGLSIFGISADPLDPNQTHLLFAPVMTAYGLAFVSILWSRLPIVISAPMLRNVHYIAIIGLCALPLILTLPSKFTIGMDRSNRGSPHWPPYYAPALKLGVGKWLTEKQICFSDQPWAVAWYADRMSIWLPPSRLDFRELEIAATNLKTPVAGILISPSSHGSGNAVDVAEKYKDFSSLVMNGRTYLATYPPGIFIFDKDQKIAEITRRYKFPVPLVGMDMIYYSDRALRTAEKFEQ